MSIDLDKATEDLTRNRIADAGRLKPGGRLELENAMDRWGRDHQLRAHVLLVDRSENIHEARPLWERLRLDEQHDLLLVSNGHDWEARGWGLSKAQLEQALRAAAPALHEYLGRGLARAVDELGSMAISRPSAPAPPSTSSTPVVFGTVGTLVLGGLGFVLWRRMKRAREERAEFDAIRGSADRAYAELVLAGEELGGGEGVDLQLRASELKKQLEGVVSHADGKVKSMNDPIVLGKIRQFESEFAALRSTVLQKAREQSCSNQESVSISPAQKPSDAWTPSTGSDPSSEPSSTSGAVRKS